MTRDDQLRIVCALLDSMQQECCIHIIKGKVPENWDGIELRAWLKDKFEYETYKMDRTRMKAYRNDYITRNLWHGT